MTVMKRPPSVSALWLAVACLLANGYPTSASVMTFTSSPARLLQGLTPALTLTCSVSDTAGSGSIIGRRDVTHTRENVQMLTSLVVMKDGKDVASVSSSLPAHVMDGSANVKVSGQTSGSTGSIQLTISYPTVNQTGEFSCEASAVSVSGHGVTFSSTAEVSSATPTLADLVTAMRDLQTTVVDLRQTNAALEQTISMLKNKSHTMVFFNARINGNPHYAVHKDVVFNYVRDNKGNDYNSANGHFTCRVPGYYHFSLGCLSMPEKTVGLYLSHNNHAVFYIHGRSLTGNTYQAASNTGTLQLAKGDVVKITTNYDSTIDGAYCSFSGHLIEAL